jgi:ribosomal protein L17
MLGSPTHGRARHQVASWLYDKSVVDSIFEEVPTRYADRRNDFTKMFPTLSRRGDNAQMVRARACVRGVARVACVHASWASCAAR